MGTHVTLPILVGVPDPQSGTNVLFLAVTLTG